MSDSCDADLPKYGWNVPLDGPELARQRALVAGQRLDRGEELIDACDFVGASCMRRLAKLKFRAAGCAITNYTSLRFVLEHTLDLIKLVLALPLELAYGTHLVYCKSALIVW